MLESNLHETPYKKKSRYLLYNGEEAVFHARKINPTTNEVEIWECRWTNPIDGKPQKEFIKKIGNETLSYSTQDDYTTAEAICWAPGRTIGNIAVNSKELLGNFEGKSGTDATLPCQIVPCGKYRNGAKRWYCKTHQSHWGTKADLEAARNSPNNEIECGSKNTQMSYVVDPFEVEFRDFEEIGVWCSLPKAISSRPIEKRSPRIHIHRRIKGQEDKNIDRDYKAVILSYDSSGFNLFNSEDISKIQLTPPAAVEFLLALEEGREVDCVSCKKCGYPHLDLGDFAKKPHKKHYCGNCGNDSVISSKPIVSTPLQPLREQFHCSNDYIDPERTLNLDEDIYSNCEFDIWPSTPAIIWTADRPQERGIHVHIYKNGSKIEDNTFSKVILRGKELDRKELIDKMIANTEGL